MVKSRCELSRIPIFRTISVYKDEVMGLIKSFKMNTVIPEGENGFLL